MTDFKSDSRQAVNGYAARQWFVAVINQELVIGLATDFGIRR
jgi:hypothetical protein